MMFAVGALIAAAVILRILIGSSSQKGKVKRKSRSSSERKQPARTSLKRRSDAIILKSNTSQLSAGEFERILALYFLNQGYKVEETGKFGNDGGVDLVITDRRGERTAVQAKCYFNKRVEPRFVRELVGAKRNHNCVLSLLITTSDLSDKAKAEAQQHHVDYWNGLILQSKFKSWKVWQGQMK